ncbi:hypothetical protein KR009_000263 [Drosophila setifemur]|nr:hypothetical protein KR009_000263 [Drosophila setifemur]
MLENNSESSPLEHWLKISVLLGIFGIFRELRPSEPFVTEYLAGGYDNLTSEQVYQNVYPIGTYSLLAQLVIVLVITDLVRYKPVIVTSALAGIVLFSLLLWSHSLGMLQVAQVFFGTFTAAEVAYYTYIYTKVDKTWYQIFTGRTRAAILCGKFLGGLLAQVLVSTKSMNIRGLLYMALITQVISLAVSLLLPRLTRYDLVEEKASPATDDGLETCKVFVISERLFYDLTSAYSNIEVLLWSIWWALATCGQNQVISNIHLLWKKIDPIHQSNYIGGVEPLANLLGAIGALLAGLLNSNKRRRFYMSRISISALVLGFLLILSATAEVIWVSYAVYAIFVAMVSFMITVASSVIAENLVDNFGLVFGLNTFVSLVLQLILGLVRGNPSVQYVVYGCYFLILGGVFIFGYK